MALRAVKVGESAVKPVRSPRKTVVEAAASGSRLDLLVSLRERLARAVQNPNCPPRDLASLTRRLQDIANEIEALAARAVEEARENAVTPDESWDAEAL